MHTIQPLDPIAFAIRTDSGSLVWAYYWFWFSFSTFI